MKRKILAGLLILAVGTVLFISCPNGVEPSVSNSKSYITLNLADEDARFAHPDKNSIVFTKFVLSGTPISSDNETVNWATKDNSDDAKKDLVRAQVTVVKGATYEFTLTALTNGGSVYKDTVTQTIQSGNNTLKFKLAIVKMGTGGDGQGTAEIGLNLPKESNGKTAVKRVTVSVYSVDDNLVIGTTPVSKALSEKEVEIAEDGTVKFESGPLDPGVYCAVFTLYGGEDGNTYLDQWREFIGIESDQRSSSVVNEDEKKKIDEGESLSDGQFIIDFGVDADCAEQVTAQ